MTALQEAYDVARKKAWSEQPAEFFAEARIEADGTLVETGGECKQGIDYSYKGLWGYHPLLLTLANTGEVLRLVNRSGNRPSHEERPRCSMSASRCAGPRASKRSCFAAIPTSRRPNISIAGTGKGTCDSYLDWT